MSRLTRHDILKEDKFLLTLETTRDFFLAKRKQVLLGLGGAGLLLLVILGIRYYLAQQDESAKDQLSAALRIYHGTVPGSAPAPGPAGAPDPVFATATEKFEKALAEFQKVATQYSSRPAGKIARYYAGLSLRELNKTNEAIAMLEPLSKDKSDYGVLAQRALVLVYESTGNLAKAVEVCQQLAQSNSAVVPKNESLMHLAQLYEQQNKSAEATKIYQQLVKDFPGTSTMAEAEQKLKQLSR
ncbi:MAG: tetratricopeptide repeat protein [Acidobacteria bacterium]|nr:tetratricopeptide repeat protein [Acidobacteriota bacterium]MCI0620186.1 tetratricopeptide repeat protein [Acidobacteriota bacterium]MCI0720304.1 tetratricopeptide repeat protein [Acidobacteriota bacterium]